MTEHQQDAETFLKLRAEHWPEAVTPVTGMMVRVFRLSRLILANATAHVEAHGLSFTEFEVMAALRSSPPPHELVPTDLYAAVLLSSGGLTKVLHGLESRGLVSRKDSVADKRSKPVRLTAKGCDIIERVMREVLKSDAQLVEKGLSGADIDRLTRLIAKLLNKVEGGAV